MTKWEYLYIMIYNETVYSINGEETLKSTSGFFNYKVTKKSPKITEFLAECGKEGWEVTGMCPLSDGAYWRVILKRPSQQAAK